MGGGLGALKFFGHLKMALELLISFCDILEPLSRYNHPWKRKIKNKHASVICLLAKNAKFYIFEDRGLETSTIGFSDTLNPMV